jgi:PII-like signaling protein
MAISSWFASFLGNQTRGTTRLWRARFWNAFVAVGFAGATVLHGVAGFGASSVIHTASLIELSTDLPVVIEVVDDQAHVDRLLPILDEMITGGALVTMERVRVLKYAAGPKRTKAAAGDSSTTPT